MRPIDQVIDAMIAALPTTAEGYDIPTLRSALEWQKKDAGYKAPEQMSEQWGVLAAFLSSAIPPPPTEDWQKRIVGIFTGEIDFAKTAK